MNIFISGGCKNGKSYLAQRLAKAQSEGNGNLFYIATMLPADDEDYERIERHRAERMGWGFDTIECHNNITKCFKSLMRDDVYLLDSVTALLANEMFKAGLSPDLFAYETISGELTALCGEFKNLVIVSDYIYSDYMGYDELTVQYCKGLGFIDRALAKICDAVIECCYGNYIIHKGSGDLLKWI